MVGMNCVLVSIVCFRFHLSGDKTHWMRYRLAFSNSPDQERTFFSGIHPGLPPKA